MDTESFNRLLAEHGGAAIWAEAAGVTRTAVLWWRRTGQIPVSRAQRIHRALAIPLAQLRPDVWPPGDNVAETRQGCQAGADTTPSEAA